MESSSVPPLGRNIYTSGYGNGRWQGNCLDVHQNYCLTAGKPAFTACYREISCLSYQTRRWGTCRWMIGILPLPCFLSKPKLTLPSKMLSIVSCPSKPSWIAPDNRDKDSLSPFLPPSIPFSYCFLFFYSSLHLSPLSLCSYWCTEHTLT